MLRTVSISALGLALVLTASCSGKMAPVKTSLGDLVKIEKLQEVSTADKSTGTIAAKSGQKLYLLSFEGKSEIAYATGSDDYYPLVDSSGRRFSPIYAGSPGADGRLAADAWTLNGQSAGKNGRFVFTGTATLPVPRVALVYEVPANTSGLALKDGDQSYPIDR